MPAFHKHGLRTIGARTHIAGRNGKDLVYDALHSLRIKSLVTRFESAGESSVAYTVVWLDVGAVELKVWLKLPRIEFKAEYMDR